MKRISCEQYSCDACDRQKTTDGGIPVDWTLWKSGAFEIHLCGECANKERVKNLLDALDAQITADCNCPA